MFCCPLFPSRETVSPPLYRHFPLIPEKRNDIVAFVNSRSGSQNGLQLLEQLRSIIGEKNTYDLSSFSLDLCDFSWTPKRLVIAGGDGTTGWVLSLLQGTPWMLIPIAPIPLGTGNELSRCLGWGETLSQTLSHEYITQLLTSFVSSREINIDRWSCTFKSLKSAQRRSLELDSYGSMLKTSKEVTKDMLCFFSIGYLDSEIALKFHCMREDYPELAASRSFNKLLHLGFGVQNLLMPNIAVSRILSLEIDGKEIVLPEKIMTVQVFNIHSSGDGVDFFGLNDWSTEKDLLQDYEQPSMSDGLLEIVGTEGIIHFLQARASAQHSRRLGQGKTVRIVFQEDDLSIPVQLDGEPWPVNGPCEITISHKDRLTAVVGPGPCRGL
eukprot:TRINITY_DN9758_c0_g1_i1.p1 TRINITY_DN9758_c0_g1~~TRINITY_DN9758_c0_g1_i1.p1  ORF type:complete len:382 (-),score=44.24 TRINITY_DN9758_c0_g1_i1:39-1184(-)